jgi:hypothetical protein
MPHAIRTRSGVIKDGGPWMINRSGRVGELILQKGCNSLDISLTPSALLGRKYELPHVRRIQKLCVEKLEHHLQFVGTKGPVVGRHRGRSFIGGLLEHGLREFKSSDGAKRGSGRPLRLIHPPP